MLLVKFIVLLLLGFVIVSLFSGLYFLVKDKGQSNRTVNALSLRIGLSIVAIVVIIIAGITGVIELNPSPLYESNSENPVSIQNGETSNGTTNDAGSDHSRRPINSQ
ncbi:MAG: twin transmembrane helix small protein [Granulosicoccus sp.]